MNKFSEDLFAHHPLIISSPYELKEPNQAILIHKGKFQIRTEDNLFDLNGAIKFKWLPEPQVHFSGTTENSSRLREFLLSEGKNNKIELLVNSSVFADIMITNWSLSNDGKPIDINGIASSDAILGDHTIPVHKIKFTLPNLRSFHGDAIKRMHKGGIKGSRGRVVFNNSKYTITIDKLVNHQELYKKLSSEGGYILLYAGELFKSKGSISFRELEDIFLCFSTFLSFLNGQRCSPLFRQGISENKVLWTDFSEYPNDRYKSVHSWTRKLSIEGFNDLWSKFGELWKNEGDKDFLTFATHWYIEANRGSGFVEGAIIMAQTALELIYNWLIIEKRKLLIGNDGNNLSAANKIRLLLSQLSLSREIPIAYKALQSFVDNDQSIFDGPEVFVQIRNAIVHGQEDKRKKLKQISDQTRYEALQLGIWYVELSLLYILGYTGAYRDRTSRNQTPEIPVPWVKENR